MIERAASAVTLRPATPATAERIAALLTDEGYPAGATDIAAHLQAFSAGGGRMWWSREVLVVS